MPIRLANAVVFAGFGALTVVAMALVFGQGFGLFRYDAAPLLGIVCALAAVSAAITGAWLGPRFKERAVGRGMFAMLMAQIPFSVFATILMAIGGEVPSGGVAQVFFGVLLFGWLGACLFQVATGALAGLVMRRWLENRPLTVAPEIFE